MSFNYCIFFGCLAAETIKPHFQDGERCEVTKSQAKPNEVERAQLIRHFSRH